MKVFHYTDLPAGQEHTDFSRHIFGSNRKSSHCGPFDALKHPKMYQNTFLTSKTDDENHTPFHMDLAGYLVSQNPYERL